MIRISETVHLKYTVGGRTFDALVFGCYDGERLLCAALKPVVVGQLNSWSGRRMGTCGTAGLLDCVKTSGQRMWCVNDCPAETIWINQRLMAAPAVRWFNSLPSSRQN